jgi:predicted enzyme related to lactoylglutathione lyase
VAGASRFYGERFGWEVDPNGLIRLPGYVDVLELHDPGIRQRHADVGTPPGFSDAVAWVAEDEGPARWELTFAVADADAAAMRAPELGAEVLQEPHDVPPVRRAEIRDPTGSVLTVNSYSP